MTNATPAGDAGISEPQLDSSHVLHEKAKPPGGFWRRVAAKGADLLWLTAPSLVLLCLMALAVTWGFPGLPLLAVIAALHVVVWVFYFAWGTSENRQTWGYRLVGLRLERTDGSAMPFHRAVERALLNAFFWLLSQACGIGLVDYLFAAFGEKRALHDRFTKSRVVGIGAVRGVLWVLGVLGFISPLGLVRLGWVPLQAYFIPSRAMEETLQSGDRLLVSKLSPRLRAPKFGEIWGFRAPPDVLVADTSRGTDLIKRCIGTPGHVIEIRNRGLLP